jgi:hypothetical protein
VPPFAMARELVRKVQADCVVEVDSNAYSVPWRLIGESVRVAIRRCRSAPASAGAATRADRAELVDGAGGRGLPVGARNHRRSCSQTEPIPARIICQWRAPRAHIVRQRACQRSAVLANRGFCSQ